MEQVSCNLLHHGAAANSSPGAVAIIPNTNVTSSDCDSSTQLVYASHLMLNVTEQRKVMIAGREETIWNVTQTLRTRTSTTAETATAAANVSTLTAKRVITCVKHIKTESSSAVILVCGFSDGSLSSWYRNNEDGKWNEQVIPDLKPYLEGRSITDLDGCCSNETKISIIVCTSGGAHFVAFEEGIKLVQEKQVIGTPCNVCKFEVFPEGLGIFLVGTAAPRHNKIHVLSNTKMSSDDLVPTYCGSLSGHEDWITCFDWITPPMGGNNVNVSFLASGSQDAKIRLWKWVTSAVSVSSDNEDMTLPHIIPAKSTDEGNDDDREDENDEEEEEIEGESRLEIYHGKNRLTCIYLEALLVGHEEMITSVAWHPDPLPIYHEDLILLSASMDRSIFIWASADYSSAVTGENKIADGVWTPIARVGSPGGILGGSVGSSLLGYLNVEVEPVHGRWIMGHGYGGALHFFSCESPEKSEWKAQPCLTGHFAEVTDLCWEAQNGDYLITVSNDQTCRVWAPTQSEKDVWIEVARPQVHGYDISAVTSLATDGQTDLIATGSDEKEIRVFEGTLSFCRTLQSVSGRINNVAVPMESKVERAYIPALGLTNKASAADGADEDTVEASKANTSLPLERNLGSTSLWPEVRKLFGHNSEIVRLTSTVSGRTCSMTKFSTTYFHDILVASTTKARDVEAANIRLWDSEYRCVQTLKGGHRSTITAIAFSPDGKYLASSGKDRRLCIWQRTTNKSSPQAANLELFYLASAVDSSHKRIVWSVHFCPYDPTFLASGSRDGYVKIWKLTNGNSMSGGDVELKEYARFAPRKGEDLKAAAVTSLSYAPRSLGGSNAILAVGFEDGVIQLWSVPVSQNETSHPTLVQTFERNNCHIGAVNKIAWKPMSNIRELLTFASCSTDCGCRIFSVEIEAFDTQ